MPANPPRCVDCDTELVEIKLLIDGQDLLMRSCSECDRRSWHQGDDDVQLHGVLADLSAAPTRYKRDLATH